MCASLDLGELLAVDEPLHVAPEELREPVQEEHVRAVHVALPGDLHGIDATRTGAPVS